MKRIELVLGSINLESNCCIEISIEEDKQNLFVCRLHTDHKDINIFSFEDKNDARIFAKHLWIGLNNFLYNEEEECIELRLIIKQALQDAEKEFQCKH